MHQKTESSAVVFLGVRGKHRYFQTVSVQNANGFVWVEFTDANFRCMDSVNISIILPATDADELADLLKEAAQATQESKSNVAPDHENATGWCPLKEPDPWSSIETHDR
jgi:hypothetical protein